MFDYVSGISGKRDLDGDKWIVSAFSQSTCSPTSTNSYSVSIEDEIDTQD